MREHINSFIGQYTQKEEQIRDVYTGKISTHVMYDEEIIPNTQWQHIFCEFEKEQNEYKPMFKRTRDIPNFQRMCNYARTFEGNEKWRVVRPTA